MLVAGVERRIQAEVYADAATHDGFSVQALAYGDGGVYVEEGCDYAAEGLQGRPGVNWCVLVYEFAHLSEVAGFEDFGFLEIL